MTVCIAALYDNGKGAVLASDHMITANIPPMAYEFESNAASKIYQLSADSYVLLAGGILHGDSIIRHSQVAISHEGHKSVEHLVNTIANEYRVTRLRYIEERYLNPRGLTLDLYYERQTSLNPGIVQSIDQALLNDNLGVEFLLAGPTGKGFSIYTITNPGIATCVDAIGYGAIGIGAPHVFHSLISAPYRKELGKSEIEKLVRKAKEMSQVSPGVGQQTSIRFLPAEEEGAADDTNYSEEKT